MAAIAAIMVAILAAISKMCKILKCTNFNENWYVGFFPHEECDSDKSDWFENGELFFYWYTCSCVCDVSIKM